MIATLSADAMHAALAGAASFLSPCALALVPSWTLYVVAMGMEEVTDGHRRSARRRLVAHAAIVALGFAVVFVALGMSLAPLADPLRAVSQPLQLLGGFVLLAFGLHAAGVMRGPSFLRERGARLTTRPAELAGALAVGVALGVAWTPCVGPTLASILMVASQESRDATGTFLLVSYTVGLITPFLAVSTALGWLATRDARLSPRLRALEAVAGLLLVIIGGILLSGRFSVLAGILSGFAPLVEL